MYSEPAWNYSAAADKCYLHQFFNWQPELNLRSTQVKEELDVSTLIIMYQLLKSVEKTLISVLLVDQITVFVNEM